MYSEVLVLPSKLQGCKLAKSVEVFLGACVSHVGQMLAETLEMDGLVLAKSVLKSVGEDDGFLELGDALVHKERFSLNAATLGQAFKIGALDTVRFPCVEMLQLLHKLQDHVQMDSLDDLRRILTQHGILPEDSASLRTSDIMALLDCYASLVKIGAFIVQFCELGHQGAFTYKDHSPIDEGCVRMVSELSKLCRQTHGFLQAPPAQLKDLEPVKWKVPLTLALEWLELILQYLLPELKAFVLRDYLSCLRSLTAAVQAITPAWKHIFPNNMYVRNLAQKELLDDKNRKELSPLTVKLFHAISSLTRAHSMFKMPTDTHLCPIASAQLAVSNQVYTDAKKAVTVVTHCHVIQELRGADQKTMAAMLLKKPQDVPAILTQELESLTGTASGSTQVPKGLLPKGTLKKVGKTGK